MYHDQIVAAYRAVRGADPSTPERDTWLEQFKDRRQDRVKLTATLQRAISETSNTALQDAIIRRAYLNARGVEPNASELDIWREDMRKNRSDYRAISNALIRSLGHWTPGSLNALVRRACYDAIGQENSVFCPPSYLKEHIALSQSQGYSALVKAFARAKSSHRNVRLDEIITRAYQRKMGRNPNITEIEIWRPRLREEETTYKVIFDSLRR